MTVDLFSIDMNKRGTMKREMRQKKRPLVITSFAVVRTFSKIVLQVSEGEFTGLKNKYHEQSSYIILADKYVSNSENG